MSLGPEDAPLPTAPARRQAPDLEPHEEVVAGHFLALERHDAPAATRRAVLAPGPAPAASHARPRGLRRLVAPAGWPLGGWGLASAALLLVALGVAVAVELSAPVSSGAPLQARDPGVNDLTIVEDGRMALFHDVRTFDDVGLAPGRILADWGR